MGCAVGNATRGVAALHLLELISVNNKINTKIN
uniref:Uncharacterized protein n=1 Tax=Arundo donax TaxID=35708 RepID=A0A0A9CHM0_ARUDO